MNFSVNIVYLKLLHNLLKFTLYTVTHKNGTVYVTILT